MLSELILVVVLAAVMYLSYLHVYVMRHLAALEEEVERLDHYQRANERQLANLVDDINRNVARVQSRVDSFLR